MSLQKKILLMGKSGAGKTSMRSIIFADLLAHNTRHLGPTVEVEQSPVRFLGGLDLSLWDCGGQDIFYENYFQRERDTIFKDVAVLIYVFDVSSEDVDRDLEYYRNCVDAISELSPRASVFCLVHKMDVVKALPERTRRVDSYRTQLTELTRGLPIEVLGTSIWNETLYKAWSSIVESLVPNVKVLEARLRLLADICEADEIVLFEQMTFLVISSFGRRQHVDAHRHEKVSNIVKQFKLSCADQRAKLETMRVANSMFTVLIQSFTPDTFLMIVKRPGAASDAAAQLNVNAARPLFTRLVAATSTGLELTNEEIETVDPSTATPSAAAAGGGVGGGDADMHGLGSPAALAEGASAAPV